MNAALRLLLALITICALGLAAGVVIVSMQSVATEKRLAALEEYVAGKGEDRDRENAELNRRIDEAIRAGRCDVLDRLSPGDVPGSLRDQLGCGPGASEPAASPSSSTAPAAGQAPQEEPEPAAPAAGATAQPSAPASPLGGASPQASTPPSSAPAAPTPPTGPAPSPAPDRGPVTDLVCGLLPPLCPA